MAEVHHVLSLDNRGGERLLPLDIRLGCLIPDETTLRHVRLCLERNLSELCGRPEHGGELIVVGGSPSVDAYLDELAALQRAGRPVFAVNGAYGHLLERGFVSDACVLLDGLPEVAGYVRDRDERTRFLVASQCHPDVFDALEGADVTVWHAWNGEQVEIELRRILDEARGDRWVIVAGGSTAALRCLNIGHLCGYRRFRMYGVDSSFHDGRTHAYEMPEQPKSIPVFCAGRSFVTTYGMAEQAALFGRIYRKVLWDCHVEAFGPGLLPHICRVLNRSKEATA